MPARPYALAILLALAGRPSPAGESLFVFFPTTVRPHVLQKGLSGSGLEVTAFGRFADFEDGVKSKPPDAILSLPEVIGSLEGYKVSVTGKRNGDPLEPYFLLGVDKAVDPSHLAGATLGIVDFLGRKGMQKLVAGIFQPPPSLKTVAKVEDLLPLLTFRMADGLLVTQVQADYFRSISQLNFVVTPIPNGRAGMICLAIRKGTEAPKAVQTVKAMDADLRKVMGGVQWD